jgi:hypothetical protein
MRAPALCANATRSPENSRTSTRAPFPVATFSPMSAMRSSTEKSGCFSVLTSTARISRSQRPRALSMMSRCPFVIGSNEPG